MANDLAADIESNGMLLGWPEAAKNRVALGLTGYFQDIMTDSGVWRSFINRHHDLYGRWLPFYDADDDYIPYELNPQDVRFLIWYTLAMNCEDRRVWDPMDKDIENAAVALHAMLDRVYEDEDTPVPEDYHISYQLELEIPARPMRCSTSAIGSSCIAI